MMNRKKPKTGPRAEISAAVRVARVCTAEELAKRVATVRLSPKESASWRRDLGEARKGLIPPTDKWG